MGFWSKLFGGEDISKKIESNLNDKKEYMDVSLFNNIIQNENDIVTLKSNTGTVLFLKRERNLYKDEITVSEYSNTDNSFKELFKFVLFKKSVYQKYTPDTYKFSRAMLTEQDTKYSLEDLSKFEEFSDNDELIKIHNSIKCDGEKYQFYRYISNLFTSEINDVLKNITKLPFSKYGSYLFYTVVTYSSHIYGAMVEEYNSECIDLDNNIYYNHIPFDLNYYIFKNIKDLNVEPYLENPIEEYKHLKHKRESDDIKGINKCIDEYIDIILNDYDSINKFFKEHGNELLLPLEKVADFYDFALTKHKYKIHGISNADYSSLFSDDHQYCGYVKERVKNRFL